MYLCDDGIKKAIWYLRKKVCGIEKKNSLSLKIMKYLYRVGLQKNDIGGFRKALERVGENLIIKIIMAKTQQSNEKKIIESENRDEYENGRPVFKADNWEGVSRYANCYAYAMNVITVKEDEHLSPGMLSNQDTNYSEHTIEELKRIFVEYIKADIQTGKIEKATDFIPCGIDTKLNGNEYKVALAFAPSPENENKLKDFHFYREDSNGLWSHKVGESSIICQKDASDKFISSSNPPENCNRNHREIGNYSVFVGYFKVVHS